MLDATPLIDSATLSSQRIFYSWQPGLARVNMLANVCVSLSYYVISIALAYFISKRPDLRSRWIFWVLGGFLVASGTGYLLNLGSFWQSHGWLVTGSNLLTALLAIATAIGVFSLIARGLEIASPASPAVNAQSLISDEVERSQVQETVPQPTNETLEAAVEVRTRDLQATLEELRQTQAQVIQNEKMSSLGQLVAGIAHEINNPVNFIYGNLNYASDYVEEILELLKLYQSQYPNPGRTIAMRSDAIDLPFLMEDLPKLLSSMRIGAERIRSIVSALRTFSRMDEAEMKPVDLHAGLDSTLLILQQRLRGRGNRPPITIVKEYGDLPPVECRSGELNQVFMNILVNAIDALEESMEDEAWVNPRQSSVTCPLSAPRITIRTEQMDANRVKVAIADNGPGIPEDVQARLFDPFFTTKPVGKGTGLGMSISYRIVTRMHHGMLRCVSQPGAGATFVVEIPIYSTTSNSVATEPATQSTVL